MNTNNIKIILTGSKKEQEIDIQKLFCDYSKETNKIFVYDFVDNNIKAKGLMHLDYNLFLNNYWNQLIISRKIIEAVKEASIFKKDKELLTLKKEELDKKMNEFNNVINNFYLIKGNDYILEDLTKKIKK